MVFPFLVSTPYITWHGRLTLWFLLTPFFILHLAYSVYKRAFCCSLSFIVVKSSDCVSYIIFIIFVCHNILTVVLPAMGLWLNFGERGIICAQAGPKWVTIGSVPTPLLRTFGPNIAGGSPTQHCKKGPPHYKCLEENSVKSWRIGCLCHVKTDWSWKLSQYPHSIPTRYPTKS